MKRQKSNLLALLVSLQLVTLCLGQAVWTAAFRGFIDFPCGYHLSQEDLGCIAVGNPVAELKLRQTLHAFIDVGEVGYGGMGCIAESSETDRLQLKNGLLRLVLQRHDERLYIDGKAWPEGQAYSRIIYWNLNAWTIYRFTATNYGTVGFCENDLPPRMVIIGRYMEEISVVKAGVLLAAMLALVVALSRIRVGPRAGVFKSE